MLHVESVAPHTLGILKTLVSLPSFKNFNLAGGTALALQIGHRISVDLDFFSDEEYEVDTVLEEIAACGYEVKILGKKANNLNLTINDVKTDILKYSYPLIDKTIIDDGVRMMGKKDIALMKISAITNRGDRKDFTDLYFLLKEYSLAELMALYVKKYAHEEIFHVYKSLIYFDDADTQAPLKMLKEASWDVIKNEISRSVNSL